MEKQKEESSVTRTNTITQENSKDGGWGWVIVASAFMAHVLADGVLFTLGVLYIEFLDEFEKGKGKTAWITSLIPGTMLTVGPITGALTNRFGCRSMCILGALVAAAGFVISCFATSIYYLYCSLGILTGLGFGGIFLSTLVCVGQHFEKRRSFALGISVSGSGVGTFVFAPVVRILIDEYGWRGAILMEAGFIMNIVLCGAFFRPVQNKSGKTTDKSVIKNEAIDLSIVEDEIDIKEASMTSKQIFSIVKNKDEGLQALKTKSTTSPDPSTNSVSSCFSKHFDFGLLTNPAFTIFVVSNYFTALGFNTPYVYLPDRAEEKGMNQFDSAFLLSIIGISNTFGRIIFGWIADRKCVNRLLLYGISLVICGTANVLNPLNDSKVYLMMYSSVYGMFIGVFVSLNTVILVDLLGSERLDKALGLLMMFQGIGCFLGPPICGWLYDGTGSYSIPFYFVGGLVIFSGVVLCFIPLYRRSQTKNSYRISGE
ncbi:monocarboxylate transporter 12-like isoform X2 [Mytilus californianus]|uniref:monocarboxylate transporter 12-like isoform X1 n=1 Tax=Mytilus californianus TaxID=6549 RepID=UPI002245D92A|nr:monocarboxylate transporter 12-like isoform X1 [Mytilus californianus]XP_052104356.1 monocarboxylate transporter 12-like isoform X2 [Mytilus californianus]